MLNSEDDPLRSRLVEANEGACRFVDWWFTPRWRALLTWMLVCSVSAWWMENGVALFLLRTCADAVATLVRFLPAAPVPALEPIWSQLLITSILYWIQPVALRLGWWRSLLWLAGLGLGSAIESWEWLGRGLVAIGTVGAMFGRRTRSWLPLAAFAAGVGVFTAYQNCVVDSPFGLGPSLANLAVALILLYGTAPIERREGTEPR